MTTVSLTTTAPDRTRADAVVIGIYAPAETGGALTAALDANAAGSGALADEVASTASLAGHNGKPGTVTTCQAPDSFNATRLIAVGLGNKPALTAETVRRAAGAASRAAAGLAKVTSTLSLVDLTAAAEGHLLGAYQFTGYRDAETAAVAAVSLQVPKSTQAARAAVRRAVITTEAVSLARDFVNTAPNDLPPKVFADRAAEAARQAGLTVEVLTEKALERGRYGGILGVGSGSSRPPRLVRIKYRPARGKKHVALVGKGVTFDSGGLSLKPAAGMDHMTSDMAGAAAIIATIIGAAAAQLPIQITATVPMAENLPSGHSYRPGDVLTHRGGKTVHVLNTDAEGRLILADAIVRACEDKPDYLLDAATLTGAQIVALGNRTMGVMGDDELRDRVAQLAQEVGEGAWAMPLPEELRDGLDSPLADIANISADRAGGMLVAGHYLREFVADGVRWAHLDVAGPAFNTGAAYGYTPRGGTGAAVRTLLAVVADLAGTSPATV